MKLEKGIKVLSKIRRLAEVEMNGNMDKFLRHAFRYIKVYAIVYPGAEQMGPGDLLNDIIEERVFFSNL